MAGRAGEVEYAEVQQTVGSGVIRGLGTVPDPTVYAEVAHITHKHRQCAHCSTLLEDDGKP